ncbi:hypothetical protein FSP39_011699 [Pinctada imbricata]|uniref:Uncharacterized protein n=1 Tax=Pinctada imbricata TaxID=66713 RepID=A0AA88YME8_PINIB|nr:hypothetical protein FSP39_011699 [Pinctada imbricata]
MASRFNKDAFHSHHASVKRKKPDKGDSSAESPIMEKSHSMQGEIIQQRPASMVVPSQSDANVSLSPSIGSLNRQNRAGTAPPIRSASPLSQKQKLPSDSDIENFMNRHKKGLFGKKMSLESMLIWSKLKFIDKSKVLDEASVKLSYFRVLDEASVKLSYFRVLDEASVKLSYFRVLDEASVKLSYFRVLDEASVKLSYFRVLDEARSHSETNIAYGGQSCEERSM